MSDFKKEVEDNSIEAIKYQGKTLGQWEKEFNGEFSAKQLFQLIKSGIDLGRIKLGLVDEGKNEDNEFFFEATDNKGMKSKPVWRVSMDWPNGGYGVFLAYGDNAQEAKTNAENELKNLGIEAKAKYAELNTYNESKEDTSMNESARGPITPEMWKEAADWFTANGYPIEDDEQRIDKIAPQLDQFLFKVGKSPTGKDEVLSGADAYDLYTQLKGKQELKESRGWYGGGYGGTGKSYSKLGNDAPRGAAIGWYSVEQLDPKARGKMPGWRCGPSNFPFVDLLYPERKYKKGVMVMRNKYLKAGEMSGEKYIAVPSYFSAIKDNDEEALKLLNALNIPLDLTFGMDPNDDYSMTYNISE